MSKPDLFKMRGTDSTRIEAFVDAAFAFALTLLVISFDAIPQSYSELIVALKGIPAFLASFCIVTMFWIAHRNWSNRFGLDTTYSTMISLALVFVILVYVYPLRTMMSAAFAFVTSGWIPDNFQINSSGDLRGLFTIYGSGFVAASFIVVLLNQHAYRLRDALSLNPHEVYATVSEIYAWLITCSVGVLSVALAWLLPEALIGLAGWVYMLLTFLMPGFAIYRRVRQP